MKAIFKVEWLNGTPQLPEGYEIDGVSADGQITGSGIINAEITASEATIEALKDVLEFVRYQESE